MDDISTTISKSREDHGNKNNDHMTITANPNLSKIVALKYEFHNKESIECQRNTKKVNERAVYRTETSTEIFHAPHPIIFLFLIRKRTLKLFQNVSPTPQPLQASSHGIQSKQNTLSRILRHACTPFLKKKFAFHRILYGSNNGIRRFDKTKNQLKVWENFDINSR